MHYGIARKLNGISMLISGLLLVVDQLYLHVAGGVGPAVFAILATNFALSKGAVKLLSIAIAIEVVLLVFFVVGLSYQVLAAWLTDFVSWSILITVLASAILELRVD